MLGPRGAKIRINEVLLLHVHTHRTSVRSPPNRNILHINVSTFSGQWKPGTVASWPPASPTPVPSLRSVASSSESGFISQFIFRLFDAVVDPFSRQAAGARGIDQCQLANGAALSTLLEHPPRHRQPLPATSHRGRSGVCPFIQSRMYFALSSSRVVHSSLALYTALSKYHLNVVIS